MRLFILCLLTITLFSCKKERTIHIIAKNAVTGERYAGLTYYVVRERTGSNGEKFKTVASGSLDANGEVTLTKKFSKNDSYVVRVEEPPNTCYNKQISQSFGSQYDVNGTFTFEFAECAYLKLNINNVNCQGPNDNFKLYYMGRQVGGQGSEIVGALAKEGTGCYTFLASEFSDVPMGKMYWKWEVTRNNVTTTYHDTINLGPSEYKTYEIDY